MRVYYFYVLVTITEPLLECIIYVNIIMLICNDDLIPHDDHEKVAAGVIAIYVASIRCG